jgi:hypothetical protein
VAPGHTELAWVLLLSSSTMEMVLRVHQVWGGQACGGGRKPSICVAQNRGGRGPMSPHTTRDHRQAHLSPIGEIDGVWNMGRVTPFLPPTRQGWARRAACIECSASTCRWARSLVHSIAGWRRSAGGHMLVREGRGRNDSAPSSETIPTHRCTAASKKAFLVGLASLSLPGLLPLSSARHVTSLLFYYRGFHL